MKADSLRIHAPTSVLFLCGGARGPANSPPTALRDAFYRVKAAAKPSYNIILAEEAQPLTTDAGYSNLLSFESDIGQIVGAILLFAESAGSLAELGAFAATPTIAPSLIAVLDDYYYGQSSFIRNGPVKFLEAEYGEEWVHVVDRDEMRIGANGQLDTLDAVKLAASIEPVVNDRLKKRSGWHRFDPENDGHAILLLTGLCQELGALTLSEVRDHLEQFGVANPRMSNFLYCAQLMGWLRRIRKGNHIFYAAAAAGSAINYELNTVRTARDKLRWRSDIRTFWQKNDSARFRAIAEALAGGEIA